MTPRAIHLVPLRALIGSASSECMRLQMAALYTDEPDAEPTVIAKVVFSCN